MSGLSADVVAHIWREHSNCTWVSTGVNVMWSCGIWHPGPIHMQPTTRDLHVAALVMTQVEADFAIHKAASEKVLTLACDIEDGRVQRPGMQRRRQWADQLRAALAHPTKGGTS